MRQIAPENALAESFVSLSRDGRFAKPHGLADRRALAPHLRRLEAEAIFNLRSQWTTSLLQQVAHV